MNTAVLKGTHDRGKVGKWNLEHFLRDSDFKFVDQFQKLGGHMQNFTIMGTPFLRDFKEFLVSWHVPAPQPNPAGIEMHCRSPQSIHRSLQSRNQ